MVSIVDLVGVSSNLMASLEFRSDVVGRCDPIVTFRSLRGERQKEGQRQEHVDIRGGGPLAESENGQ